MQSSKSKSFSADYTQIEKQEIIKIKEKIISNVNQINIELFNLFTKNDFQNSKSLNINDFKSSLSIAHSYWLDIPDWYLDYISSYIFENTKNANKNVGVRRDFSVADKGLQREYIINFFMFYYVVLRQYNGQSRITQKGINSILDFCFKKKLINYYGIALNIHKHNKETKLLENKLISRLNNFTKIVDSFDLNVRQEQYMSYCKLKVKLDDNGRCFSDIYRRVLYFFVFIEGRELKGLEDYLNDIYNSIEPNTDRLFDEYINTRLTNRVLCSKKAELELFVKNLNKVIEELNDLRIAYPNGVADLREKTINLQYELNNKFTAYKESLPQVIIEMFSFVYALCKIAVDKIDLYNKYLLPLDYVYVESFNDSAMSIDTLDKILSSYNYIYDVVEHIVNVKKYYNNLCWCLSYSLYFNLSLGKELSIPKFTIPPEKVTLTNNVNLEPKYYISNVEQLIMSDIMRCMVDENLEVTSNNHIIKRGHESLTPTILLLVKAIIAEFLNHKRRLNQVESNLDKYKINLNDFEIYSNLCNNKDDNICFFSRPNIYSSKRFNQYESLEVVIDKYNNLLSLLFTKDFPDGDQSKIGKAIRLLKIIEKMVVNIKYSISNQSSIGSSRFEEVIINPLSDNIHDTCKNLKSLRIS